MKLKQCPELAPKIEHKEESLKIHFGIGDELRFKLHIFLYFKWNNKNTITRIFSNNIRNAFRLPRRVRLEPGLSLGGSVLITFEGQYGYECDFGSSLLVTTGLVVDATAIRVNLG